MGTLLKTKFLSILDLYTQPLAEYGMEIDPTLWWSIHVRFINPPKSWVYHVSSESITWHFKQAEINTDLLMFLAQDFNFQLILTELVGIVAWYEKKLFYQAILDFEVDKKL